MLIFQQHLLLSKSIKKQFNLIEIKIPLQFRWVIYIRQKSLYLIYKSD